MPPIGRKKRNDCRAILNSRMWCLRQRNESKKTSKIAEGMIKRERRENDAYHQIFS